MLKNYFIVAWRNLTRNKTLAVINIGGLALGMAFAILIGLWIQHEKNYDGFHKNKERIALVMKHSMMNNQKLTGNNLMLPIYDELKNNYPEIKHITRLDWRDYSLIVGDKMLNKSGLHADPDFQRMFSFHVIKGDGATALQQPDAIILTESLATALFGSSDVIGKRIKLDNRYDVQVTAIVQDVPKNSSITFDFLTPFAFLVQNNEGVRGSLTRWNNSIVSIAVETKEGASMEALSKKISTIPVGKDAYVKQQSLSLHPITRWRLYDDFKDWVNNGGRIQYVHLFGIIGIFVLLIACINFMNLSTARSEKRAKEVGVRKAVGSARIHLIIQFLIESVLTALLAFVLSLLIIQVSLPWLSDLGFGDIRLDFSNLNLWAGMLGVCLFTGLIAGCYPALYLSSLLPVKVLKGVIQQRGKAINLRKILVVGQFTVSIALVISTIIVLQQISHAKSRSMGYRPDNLITLDGSADLKKNYQALKHELLSTGNIEAVAKASSAMNYVSNDFTHFKWEGKDPATNMSIDVVMTEWDYEKAAGLEFVAGRPFSMQYKTDSNAVILNEAAARLIGYKDPIGKTIQLGDKPLMIVGVTKNVLMRNPFKSVGPGVILFNAESVNAVLIRLKDNADLQKSLSAIQAITEKYNPSLPFEYRFADESFALKFETENQVAKLASIFAVLAIFISCLGVLGLAMFTAEQRAREISIRKVLGASVANLWLLLSKQFIWLVLIACLLASPLAYWLMKSWLNNYEYRISISGWIFIIAGAIALIITLATVSSQSIKAANANPARRLKAD
jgi:ABC-type antimicrobial peptide transport system permease subunit